MPPKKVDPQAQRRDHEAWKESDQWLKIEEVYKEFKSLPYISETSKDYDIDGKYQAIWDLLYELATFLKVKPPFKKIEHQWVRSIYFGEKRKTDTKDVPCYFDGVHCEFDPVDADSAYNIRQVLFKKIFNLITDMDNFDAENYVKTKADLKKGFSEFFSLMKTHIKKSFKIIFDEKLMIVMQPLSDILQINMKLVFHELKYTKEDEKFINLFKYTAIVDRYCVCLEKILDILSQFHERPVKFSIKPRNIFKKLDYINLTKIESFYLTPYRAAFDEMKQGLCAQFSTGMNFWKVPIERNEKFVKDLLAVINWELIVEKFFGSPILRDQINFVADTLNLVASANELSKKYLISQDPNCIQITVPRLIAFKTIQHMRFYKDKQAEIQQKEIEHSKLMGMTMKSQIKEEGEDTGSNLNSSGMNQTSAMKNISRDQKFQLMKSKIHEQEKEEDPLEAELKALGRYWIWENYCDDEFRDNVVESAVELLKHINKAVHQDIEDSIIRDGMLPRRDRQNEELKEAAEILKGMKTHDNALKKENMKRPPELWNFPKVIEEEHHFRSIADPKKCYIDGRIEELDAKIVEIGDYLRKHQEKEWNHLIKRVIDFFAGSPDENPFGKVVEEVVEENEEEKDKT